MLKVGRSRRRVAPVLVAGACLLGLGLNAPAAGAAADPGAPIPVAASSLRQDGLDLVWGLKLQSSFSPSSLRHDGRSLCLLLERSSSSRVFSQLCVIGPSRPGRPARIVLQHVTASGAGKAHVISARVTRGSSRSLTARFTAPAAGLDYRPLRWQVISTLRPPACTPPQPNRIGCFVVFPARSQPAALHQPIAAGCVPSGPASVSSGPSKRRVVALTFDDGPWNDPPPDAFLRVLERKHVVGTFFEIGNQISRLDPGGRFERRMLADGDFIGNHSWSHPLMTHLSSGEQEAQLTSTSAAITRATGGFRTCLFRPPYGDVNSSLVSVARSLGLLTILWDIDPRDWSRPGEAAIYSTVVGGAHNGAIVLQHFGGGPRYQTLDALPHEIDTLRARGYGFVTIPELLGLRVIYR